jgi:hypothetical protein
MNSRHARFRQDIRNANHFKNMGMNTTDWTRLREFKDVDLTASFVLSWHRDDDALVLDLDLCLTPEHAFFEPPRRTGGACIRPALLEFPHCSRLASDEQVIVNDDIGPFAAKLAHGKINGLRRIGDGRYRISGEFGDVIVDAERPILRLGGKSK